MTNGKKKAVVFGNNYWGSPYQVGSHFFAREFSKAGCDVLYISDPINLGHKILAKNDPDLIKRAGYSSPVQVEEGIWAYVPDVLISCMRRPLLDNRMILDNWWRLSLPSVKGVISKAGFHNPDFVFFNSLHFNWALREYPKARTCLRMADWNSGMSGTPRAAVQAQLELMEKCDHVYAASQAAIDDHFSKDTSRTIEFLPNGVDLDSLNDGNPFPEEYRSSKGLGRKIAVYVGAIDDRFDLALVRSLARAMPELDIYIIGKITRTDDVLDGAIENLKFIGPRPFAEISSYLEHADVGLMPQTRSCPAADYFNPLKMYQYMYFGLPIVSTWWKELGYLAPPIDIVSDADGFVEKVREAVSRGAHERGKYEDFLTSHTWRGSFDIVRKSLGF